MCPGNNIFDPATLSCTSPDQVSCLQSKFHITWMAVKWATSNSMKMFCSCSATTVSTTSSAPESTSVSTPDRTPSANTGTSSQSATSTSTEGASLYVLSPSDSFQFEFCCNDSQIPPPLRQQIQFRSPVRMMGSSLYLVNAVAITTFVPMESLTFR